MKEVVWIFGTSAAGKQTFVKRVLTDKKLAKKLGWENKTIVACQESLNLLGHVGNEEIVKARKSITKIVPKLLENADVVLIKWQYVDSHNLTPEKLKELLPMVQHKIILLKVEPDEAKQRLATKTWWKEFWDNTRFADREIEMVNKCIKQLSSDFDITILDSGKNKDYGLTN